MALAWHGIGIGISLHLRQEHLVSSLVIKNLSVWVLIREQSWGVVGKVLIILVREVILHQAGTGAVTGDHNGSISNIGSGQHVNTSIGISNWQHNSIVSITSNISHHVKFSRWMSILFIRAVGIGVQFIMRAAVVTVVQVLREQTTTPADNIRTIDLVDKGTLLGPETPYSLAEAGAALLLEVVSESDSVRNIHVNVEAGVVNIIACEAAELTTEAAMVVGTPILEDHLRPVTIGVLKILLRHLHMVPVWTMWGGAGTAGRRDACLAHPLRPPVQWIHLQGMSPQHASNVCTSTTGHNIQVRAGRSLENKHQIIFHQDTPDNTHHTGTGANVETRAWSRGLIEHLPVRGLAGAVLRRQDIPQAGGTVPHCGGWEGEAECGGAMVNVITVRLSTADNNPAVLNQDALLVERPGVKPQLGAAGEHGAFLVSALLDPVQSADLGKAITNNASSMVKGDTGDTGNIRLGILSRAGSIVELLSPGHILHNRMETITIKQQQLNLKFQLELSTSLEARVKSLNTIKNFWETDLVADAAAQLAGVLGLNQPDHLIDVIVKLNPLAPYNEGLLSPSHHNTPAINMPTVTTITTLLTNSPFESSGEDLALLDGPAPDPTPEGPALGELFPGIIKVMNVAVRRICKELMGWSGCQLRGYFHNNGYGCCGYAKQSVVNLKNMTAKTMSCHFGRLEVTEPGSCLLSHHNSSVSGMITVRDEILKAIGENIKYCHTQICEEVTGEKITWSFLQFYC